MTHEREWPPYVNIRSADSKIFFSVETMQTNARKNCDEILRELSQDNNKKNRYTWDVYSVNVYNPTVKTHNWWYHREGFPKDYDAYHPPGDTKRSSYIRLGTCEEDKSHWTTETMESMQQGRGDYRLAELIKQSQRRLMLTFMNYPRTEKPRKDLLTDEIRMILPSLPRDQMKMRYSTTYSSCFKGDTQ
ncbi:UNVERIFIED_CONTAM: hypothetical protein PYX00_006330 [Menopon gallinae]|uniref:Uncharacterized protein n=1 Tax=Menopon gallinae TaxID=328185 RepID=A0AAW2HV36_9NEOP